ncbi:putative ribonuclease H-like domain-containing protein, partial [Tanacetum coccineum]
SGKVPISTARQSSPRATVPISTAKPVNTAAPKSLVNVAKYRTNVFQKRHSPTKRPVHQETALKNRNLKNKVNSIKRKFVNTVKTKRVTSAVGKKGGDPQVALKDTGIFDSRCSTHMTENKSYLIDYQDYNGGFVAFAGSSKGGRITGKGKIKNGKLDFEDTICLILSPDFKLPDEKQVMLKIPRKDNMYSFDLKNIVPSKGLTCLIEKATNDESKLWHRRLGHINFKTLNKLVKGNLIRGLPSKFFENDHTCVTCQKGKQHKATCKSKLVTSISQPLQILHMDLFRPTFVKSLMGKMYCLVITNDYSRFSWVFFIAKKDETSGILRNFITWIENQLNHRVKIIRSDNRTEFKNQDLNQFCNSKGIKREYNNARTPQQNGVAERKNMTLIEAARTMLADSLLPIPFWAEAVNTTCYVQNRVLVSKPHNKTPYELLIGRPPIISFMRPFGCPVTILNTLDHLGKFDGKADEGVLVGYSISSKAFRVFNHRTRKVEENLHVNFLEKQPNIARNRPKWMFDIDSLTITMNYHPVSAGNRANVNVGIETNSDAGQAEKEKVLNQEYILLPLMHTSSYGPSTSEEDVSSPNDDDAGKKVEQEPANVEDHTLKDAVNNMLNQERMATKHSDDARSQFEEECDAQLFKGMRTRTSSTNSFNTVRTPLNTASALRTSYHAGTSSEPQLMPINGSFSIDINDYPDDPLMPELEDTAEIHSTGIFGSAYDDSPNTPINDQSVGAEADFNNMEPSINVSPISTTRIHSIHPKGFRIILGGSYTGRASTLQVTQCLDSGRFYLRKRRPLVLNGSSGIKKIREGLWIEAIRLFLAYASYMDFTVYQMDVKSAFLYGTTEEEVYVNQPPGFEDPEFPNKSYKVEKSMYGSSSTLEPWYKTLSTYLLENGFRRGTIDKTLFIKKIKNDILLVQVYADDIILGSTKKSLSTEFEKLMHKRFQMSSMGKLTFFLGLQVE